MSSLLLYSSCQYDGVCWKHVSITSVNKQGAVQLLYDKAAIMGCGVRAWWRHWKVKQAKHHDAVIINVFHVVIPPHLYLFQRLCDAVRVSSMLLWETKGIRCKQSWCIFWKEIKMNWWLCYQWSAKESAYICSPILHIQNHSVYVSCSVMQVSSSSSVVFVDLKCRNLLSLVGSVKLIN